MSSVPNWSPEIPSDWTILGQVSAPELLVWVSLNIESLGREAWMLEEQPQCPFPTNDDDVCVLIAG